LANFSFSETQLPKLPENLNQAKKLGEKFLKELQEILKKIWQKIGDWLENKIFPKIKTEIEKRKKFFNKNSKKKN
jgi:phage-related minor tail protein